ncbi:hypothetical protein MMC34_002115 [Xylographa carneopallida]|nr:hypothetical protein [Xylographa carneopallida]
MTDADSPCPAPPPPSSLPTRLPTPQSSHLLSARSLRQLSLFATGSVFFGLSILVTRRSVARRRLAIFPSFYHPSNQPPRQSINGPVEAVEALGLATVNVLSFAIMAAGGTLWAFDIAGVEELRRKVRGGLGVDGSGRGEREVEEEWEEWLAGVVERRRRRGEGKAGEVEGGEEEVAVRNERGKRR